MLARIEAAGVGPRIPTLAEREKVALLARDQRRVNRIHTVVNSYLETLPGSDEVEHRRGYTVSPIYRADDLGGPPNIDGYKVTADTDNSLIASRVTSDGTTRDTLMVTSGWRREKLRLTVSQQTHGDPNPTLTVGVVDRRGNLLPLDPRRHGRRIGRALNHAA